MKNCTKLLIEILEDKFETCTLNCQFEFNDQGRKQIITNNKQIDSCEKEKVLKRIEKALESWQDSQNDNVFEIKV